MFPLQKIGIEGDKMGLTQGKNYYKDQSDGACPGPYDFRDTFTFQGATQQDDLSRNQINTFRNQRDSLF
ncbi:UNKNOWN [Stylonychia lemnae]|uniref:Uncharacterized protein n=1 Tax=Stylonychia lemnae TaxID=5949 RepID=A0A078ADC2_STYLE|nr:UNKNOWN [Stylonychia lemnae]|eukprot:CDW79527.1 UNKNOWN [Stylonychia lemnae]